MPLDVLWRQELSHPTSMQHRAHNVRAGDQSHSNSVCACLCIKLCVCVFMHKRKHNTKKFTRQKNTTDGLGCFSGSFDDSDHRNAKKCCKYRD